MLVRVLLKSNDTVRASCSAHSSFCFWIRVVSPEFILAGAAPGLSPDNCSKKYFWPSREKQQIDVGCAPVDVPPLHRNFKICVGEGERSHSWRNCSAVRLFSSAQITESNAAPSMADPKTFR